MTILLLVIIYIAFIGLGLPDSLIGSAWPGIYPEFGLPNTYISFITFTISGCTVLSSMFSDKIINKLGTGKVAAFSTALTALAILGFSFSEQFIFLVLLAIPLGLGAGAIDSSLNNYIALHYTARHMNYLHCFYGIGVSCSPYLMSMALSNTSWRDGYKYAFIVQIVITLILVLSLPLWKKNGGNEDGEDVKPVSLSFIDAMKRPEIRMVLLIMLATNAIEYACGTWGSTFLVEARGFNPDSAAILLTLYYAGMALGRFTSGVLENVIKTWSRIAIGVCIVFVAVILMLVPNGVFFSAAGLFFIGFGNGSIYPNLIYLTPYNFGKEVSQSIMGFQIAAAYTGVMLTPPLFGLVSSLLGIKVYPIFLVVLWVLMAVSILVFVKKMKSLGRFDKNV